MNNLVEATVSDLRNLIMEAAGKAVAEEQFAAAPLTPFTVEVPADRSHGDLAVNAAMVWARDLHMPPRKIADTLLSYLSFPSDSAIARAEVAGPGFLNFFLADRYYSRILKQIESQGAAYGRSDFGGGKRVLVEFVSANPTGPMHMGNARGGALGDCLASVLEAAGFQVAREFYVNDAGNQIEKFKTSLEIRYLQHFGVNVEMPEDAYMGDDITAHAVRFAEQVGDRYVEADPEERRQALCDYALPLNIQKLHDDLSKYRITYDRWFRESELHNDGSVKRILDKLVASGHTYEQEGALWFRSTDFGEEKDRVLVRANGIPTYFVPDIAYHYNKLVERGFDLAIDVLGADHHGYVPRMKAALEALGVDPARLDAVIMQMVRLVKNGETYKLSKRSGKAITLETLLDEVPIDAARFFFNLREPNSHLEFDLDLAVEQSSQNPVYYVQYAHARICSILKNLAAQGVTYRSVPEEDLDVLREPAERDMIRHLSSLEAEIVAAAKQYDPSRVTRYAIELATLFHKYYNACRVHVEDEKLMYARLFLCVQVRQVLRNVLDLLKIDAPEVM